MFKNYKRLGVAEAENWVVGYDMSGISISEPDLKNGSPKQGDMIARNPKNHNDKWLISKKYFEEYFELDAHIIESSKNLSFGKAIEAIKNGKRLARKGWNGKNMWIALTPGSVIKGDQARSGACKLLNQNTARVLGTDINIIIDSHIDMKTVSGSILPGWLASQTDMLANDWEIVD